MTIHATTTLIPAVLLNDFVAGEGLSGVLRSAPAVLGVVMRKSEEHKRWSVSRILLGGAHEKGGVYVLAFRRDGVLDLRGEGSIDDRMIDFHSVQRAGALAVSARAYWHGASVTVAGIASLARTPGRAPRSVAAGKGNEHAEAQS